MFITMLKTNNKKARENVRNYIIAEFTPEGCTDNPPQEFPEIACFILTTFRREKYHLPQDFCYYRHNEYVAFADWCAGLAGVLDTRYYYNRSAVDDLGAILEETDEEKAKYTEDQAENTSVHSVVLVALINFMDRFLQIVKW